MKNPFPAIDELYEEFRARAPERLRTPIRNLACTLGLAPTPTVPWSQVFNHEVTVAAPWMVSEALHAINPELTGSACLAHLLAVIEAFGTDRIQDGQVEPTEALTSVLAEIRSARDQALGHLAGAGCAKRAYAVAQSVTHASICRERELLEIRAPTSLREYQRISSGKQAVGMPACLCLARSAGLDPDAVASIERMLLCVWMGLQVHDDVADWQDDAMRGGAWAINLARWRLAAEPPSSPDAIRSFVHRSGVLASMLRLSRRQYRSARRRASVLGASRLARWCHERERDSERLADREADHPGYVIRARALSALEHEVLA